MSNVIEIARQYKKGERVWLKLGTVDKFVLFPVRKDELEFHVLDGVTRTIWVDAEVIREAEKQQCANSDKALFIMDMIKSLP